MKLGSLNINIPQSHYDRFDEKSRSRKNKVHVFHGYRDDSVSFQPTPARLRPEPQAEPPTEDATLKELEVEGEVIQLPQNPDVASCKPPSCDEVEDVITAADGEGTEEETDGRPRRKKKGHTEEGSEQVPNEHISEEVVDSIETPDEEIEEDNGISVPDEEAEDVASCSQKKEGVVSSEDGHHGNTETATRKVRKARKKKRVRSKKDSGDAKFKCQYCERTFNSPSARLHHTKSKHVGVKYDCNQCDKHFTHQSSLTTHIQSTHEGVKYACNQCDYQATQKSHLTRHMKSKHM